MSERIAERSGPFKHDEEIGFLTSLLIDLKKRELGRPHGEISMERLEEASRQVRKLFVCRGPGLMG